jgi:hypothetical protein
MVGRGGPLGLESPMSAEDSRRLVHFEVHVQRGERWTIELTAGEEELACERARQFLQRADVDGVKVWKEVYHQGSGLAAGRLVLAETRPKLKGRWRFGRWTSVPDETNATPEPEGYVRRNVAPPPPLPTDWPVAICSIGGGCAALVALAVLAALG